MKKTLTLVSLLTAVVGAAAADMPLERIVSDPPLQGAVPRQVEISKGGGWVSELRPSAQDSNELELWARPIQGGPARRLASAAEVLGGHSEALSEAEKMALERKRIQQRGITGYQWCGQGDDKLLFPLSGHLYLVTLGQKGKVERLTFDEGAPAQDPVCSPDGRQLAYVKAGNLWVRSLDGAKPRQLTRDGGTQAVGWGLAEFIAAEELGREEGYWWSPDGKSILALRVDESAVPLKTRAQIFADRTELYQQRYPAAGTNNARVTAWRIDVGSGAAVPLQLPTAAEYIGRAGWFADGTPWLQWFTRDQKRLVLTEFAGAPRDVIDERDADWVEVQKDLAELNGLMLSGKPALLWSSEASGRRQLVVVDRVTGARRPLTNEPEPVSHLVCTDGQRVVYAAARERGRSRGLFVTDLQGRASPIEGAQAREWRDAVADRACRQLLITRSAWAQPPRLSVQAVEGRTATELPGVDADPLLAEVAPTPQPLDLIAADGRTVLNGFYFRPLDGKPGAHPVITLAYGGPGTSTVRWAWYRDTALIAHWQRAGYGVFMVDNRGMSERDRAFTRAHAKAFGQVEVGDLFAAVRQLPRLVDGVDPARIGFFGWSYGGYLAARAMLDADTPIAAAVAVAPPADWTLYDTAYTERYLGLPEDGKAASYAQASLLPRAGLLARPLLIVHGTADDNVLFEHSLRLIESLQDQGRLFDLDIFPGKAHGLGGSRNSRLHLWRTLDAFFARNLKP
jgi:dipeptidyl-peptidase-4